MRPRRAVALGLLAALAIVPATRAQDAPPAPGGGTAVTGQVPSLLELSVVRLSSGVVAAEVTASIPRTQLLAAFPTRAADSSPSLALGRAAPRPVAPAQRLALSAWRHATTRSRVRLRARVDPARAQSGAVLEITAAPQTP